jgi:glutamate-1-semialdehyde 2,1-aminomutase
MPVGCFGGKAKIINHIAPTGPIYQAGTLSGNPVAMAAGLAALSQLEEPDLYTSIFDNTQKLAEGLTALAHKHGIPMTYNVAGSMFGIFFTDAEKVTNYQQAISCNNVQFKAFYHGMLEQGVYLAPAIFEAGFVSKAHTADIIDATLAAADKVFQDVAHLS